MQNNYVGIDVSGQWLDTHIEPLAQTRRFTNNTQGLEALVQWLGAHAIGLVAMEATGGLERICALYLRARKYDVRVFNPSRIAGFRDALGKQAKTDAVDAKVIALFALSMPRTACIEPDPALRDLKDLGARHTQLTQMIAAEKNRITRVHHFFAKRSIDRVIDALLAERKALEREMRKIVDDVAVLKRQYDILISIPGIGPLTALTLLHSMPELGRVTDRQIAALAGVAPMNNDSGKNTGRAHLRGGRKHVRQMLYMAAMAAKRFNPKIKAFFDRLIKNGKPRMVALAACMRKLLIIANVMVERQQLWQNAT